MSKGKKIALTVIFLVLVVFLGRETGIYDFHLANSKSQGNLKSSTSHGGSSVVSVKEAQDGATLRFSDGSTGTLKVNRIAYSGVYFLPLVKQIKVDMDASVTSSD